MRSHPLSQFTSILKSPRRHSDPQSVLAVLDNKISAEEEEDKLLNSDPENVVEDLAGCTMSTLLHVTEVHLSAFCLICLWTGCSDPTEQTQMSECSGMRFLHMLSHKHAHTLSDLWEKGKTDGDGEECVASADRAAPAGPPKTGCFDDVAASCSDRTAE